MSLSLDDIMTPPVGANGTASNSGSGDGAASTSENPASDTRTRERHYVTYVFHDVTNAWALYDGPSAKIFPSSE
ncbi:hypothetical protein HK102_005549, partial [Quaeritorhiza haematococci]